MTKTKTTHKYLSKFFYKACSSEVGPSYHPIPSFSFPPSFSYPLLIHRPPLTSQQTRRWDPRHRQSHLHPDLLRLMVFLRGSPRTARIHLSVHSPRNPAQTMNVRHTVWAACTHADVVCRPRMVSRIRFLRHPCQHTFPCFGRGLVPAARSASLRSSSCIE